jgi:molecular chaperone HtpG
MAKSQAKKETLKFDAEIGKVLDLMIHSLYTNKDIFIRELLSNASDALDKLRYQLLTDDKLNEKVKDQDLEINLAIDKEAKTISFSDNGIGMNHDDLLNNLGTIAKSGTEGFLANITGDKAKDVELIGQFGVGFYSVFMVADKVTVASKKAGEDKIFQWESNGKGEFTIEELAKDENFSGTKITAHIKPEEDNFIDPFHVKHVIRTYSNNISFPIKIKSSDSDQPEAEIANEALALWTKNKSKISDDDYKKFYKTLSHAVDEPWLTLHNKAEGAIEYTSLLFIPTKKPFDLFHPDRKCRVKLYVKKIFITEDNVNIIPQFMRFVRGVVDSQDLPLNISRETLQNNLVIDKIRSSLVKKVLTELGKKLDKNREDFESFWNNFGAVLKEGLCEFSGDKEKILDLCLFKTNKSEGKYIRLSEYISRMKPNQDSVYFLSGDNFEAISKSPQLEIFNEKDLEVLLLDDAVDDFWVTSNPTFKEKTFKAVTRVTDELEKIETPNEDKSAKSKKEKETKKFEKDLKDLVEFMKETLTDNVSDVRISHKLKTSPVCLAVSETGMDIRMERMMMEQGQIKEASKKILEINPNHNIIKGLDSKFQADKKDIFLADAIRTLFDQACIIEGENIKDPLSLVERIGSLLEKQVA